MRRVLALFFVFIFSFQALPLKAIGQLLAKSQLTEEVKGDCTDSDDDSKDGKDGKEGKDGKDEKFNDLIHTDKQSFLAMSSATGIYRLSPHRNDNLPLSYVKEIHCPPPKI